MFTQLVKGSRRIIHGIWFGSYSRRDRIRFLRAGHLIVDPTDNRGSELIRCAGVTQPKLTHFWRWAVRSLSPTLILDIGANYGEISLCTTYGSNAVILLFEPNPRLHPYLAKSISSHPQRSHIFLRTELVSDEATDYDFYVDDKWSGTSSAIGPISDHDNIYKGPGPEHFRVMKVESVRVDDCVRDVPLHATSLLFKIDVEGYEARVIAGMRDTLSKVASFLGLVEFDQDYLRRAGVQPNDFLCKLQAIGQLHVLSPLTLAKVTSVEDLPPHCDLVVSTFGLQLPKFPWWPGFSRCVR